MVITPDMEISRRTQVYVKAGLETIDITGRCYMVNTETGEAQCYKHDAQGRLYVDDGEVARETIPGAWVRIVPMV